MSLNKQQVGNIIWGLVFIGIAAVGGIVLGGIVGKSLGMLIAGICGTLLGIFLIFQPTTFEPVLVPPDEFHVFATFSRLPWWGWIIVVVLLGGAFAAIGFAKDVPLNI